MGLKLDDICDMFDEHIDSMYEPFVLDDLKISASEILKEYPIPYEQKFTKFMDDYGISWVQTQEDGYYTITKQED